MILMHMNLVLTCRYDRDPLLSLHCLLYLPITLLQYQGY